MLLQYFNFKGHYNNRPGGKQGKGPLTEKFVRASALGQSWGAELKKSLV